MFEYVVKNKMLETCAIITKEKEKANESELQEQEQLSIIVIKEKTDKTEFQKQEQHNVIVTKLPDVEKRGEVSKQLDETGFGTNKEKTCNGKKFKKFGTLWG